MDYTIYECNLISYSNIKTNQVNRLNDNNVNNFKIFLNICKYYSILKTQCAKTCNCRMIYISNCNFFLFLLIHYIWGRPFKVNASFPRLLHTLSILQNTSGWSIARSKILQKTSDWSIAGIQILQNTSNLIDDLKIFMFLRSLV